VETQANMGHAPGGCRCARVGDLAVDVAMAGIATEPGTAQQTSIQHAATLPEEYPSTRFGTSDTSRCTVGVDHVRSQDAEAHDGVSKL
jgi:hypothetical protein